MEPGGSGLPAASQHARLSVAQDQEAFGEGLVTQPYARLKGPGQVYVPACHAIQTCALGVQASA
jgi:hypothetical protein